ncbi:MAG: DUF3098 domain-containing protein [Bacteroidales bacterium]|jgi:hypothetical protein|nr:DUF3098 domain-containing protein [Bacteroidales bacterium]
MAKTIAKTKSTAKSTAKNKKTAVNKHQVIWAPGMPFGKLNYILLLVAIIVLAIGYILLSGGGSDDPSIFNEAIFDTRRLTIAPLTLLSGIIIGLISILVKVKPPEENKTTLQK